MTPNAKMTAEERAKIIVENLKSQFGPNDYEIDIGWVLMHIQDAEQIARADALEEAAQIAEKEFRKYSFPVLTDAEQNAELTSLRIRDAIRALAKRENK